MKHGIFKVTDKGLVEEKPQPLKVKIGKKSYTVNPENPMYSVVSYYGVKV